jgi:CRP-like cAMP-binding protein
MLNAARSALSRSPVLAHLSPEGLERLAERGLDMTLSVGQTLFSKGDPGDSLFVILEGEIEISLLHPGGKALRLASRQSSDVVGEMAVLSDLPRSADATAVRRTRLVKLGREAVREALLAEPEALLAIVQDLAARLRHANDELEAVTSLSLKGRLARLLLAESEGGARLVQMNQTEIARRLGASREKVNRALHAFKQEGAVLLTRAGVRIAEPSALSDEAEPEGR